MAEQMRQHFRAADIVGGHDLKGVVCTGGTEDVPADPAEAIDPYSGRQPRLPPGYTD